MSAGRSRAFHFMVVLLMAAAPAADAGDAQPRVWNFSVYLDDKPIGYQRFTLSEGNSGHELTTTARFNVKLLFISVYRYVHDATEYWQGDCLTGLKASTSDGGKLTVVETRPDEGRLAVSATGRHEEMLTGCVMSFAYWNPAILRQSHLLNSQTGEYEAIRVTQLDTQDIQVRGNAVAATHYHIDGPKHPIDLWYSRNQEWLALESPLDGGRRLRYRLE